MPEPRHFIQRTEARGKLDSEFWYKYSVDRRDPSRLPRSVGTARNLFSPQTIARIEDEHGLDVLDIPVILTDDVQGKAAAAFRYYPDRSQPPWIAINARLLIDPAVLVHSLAEEVSHFRQYLDGVDFATEQQLPYLQRPHEQEAKAAATRILGYEPPHYQTLIKRPMPEQSEFYGSDKPDSELPFLTARGRP